MEYYNPEDKDLQHTPVREKARKTEMKGEKIEKIQLLKLVLTFAKLPKLAKKLL